MALWSALYPDLTMFVPGCPDPVLEQEVRKAAREFFRRTRAWTQWLDEIPLSDKLREYDVDLPTGAEVVILEKATLNGRPIEASGYRALSADPIEHEGTGGLAVVSADRLTLLLTQAAGKGDRLQVQASLMPTRTSTGIPDLLLSKHAEAIAEGAKHRLMRTPGPLHRPIEAEEARVLFEAAVASASVSAWRGNTNVTPRARPKWC